MMNKTMVQADKLASAPIIAEQVVSAATLLVTFLCRPTHLIFPYNSPPTKKNQNSISYPSMIVSRMQWDTKKCNWEYKKNLGM